MKDPPRSLRRAQRLQYAGAAVDVDAVVVVDAVADVRKATIRVVEATRMKNCQIFSVTAVMAGGTMLVIVRRRKAARQAVERVAMTTRVAVMVTAVAMATLPVIVKSDRKWGNSAGSRERGSTVPYHHIPMDIIYRAHNLFGVDCPIITSRGQEKISNPC